MEYLLEKLWFIKFELIMYKFYIIIISTILLFGSCEKAETDNKMDYLINGNWVIGSYTINGVNAMDTIKKYYPDPRIDISIAQIESYDLNYLVFVGDYAPYTGNENATLIFHRGNLERCSISLFSKYIMDSVGIPDYYYHDLSNYVVPISAYHWDVVELTEERFVLSCFYKNDRITLYLINN